MKVWLARMSTCPDEESIQMGNQTTKPDMPKRMQDLMLEWGHTNSSAMHSERCARSALQTLDPAREYFSTDDGKDSRRTRARASARLCAIRAPVEDSVLAGSGLAAQRLHRVLRFDKHF